MALGAAGLVAIGVLWEVYKLLGPEQGVSVGATLILPRTSDLAMPHVWEMFTVFGTATYDENGTTTILAVVLRASWFTFKIAALGWLVAVVVGLALAVVMARFRLFEQAMLPWIILSQTVPLIAIAPLVGRWGSQLHIGGLAWTNELSVAVIAAYLAFFPIAVGALRGLRSPDATHVDLMDSYGVGWWRALLVLRLPASVPYLLSSLRLAAASAVIGTVVAEVSIGLTGGIGRLVVDYAQSAGGNPAQPWAPIFGAIAVGLVAAGLVSLLGLTLKAYRRTEVNA